MSQLGRSGAHKLVNPTCNSNDYECAHDSGENYWNPLVGDNPETIHKTDTCGHKEESEIMHKETGKSFHPSQLHNSQFERCSQEHHADNA